MIADERLAKFIQFASSLANANRAGVNLVAMPLIITPEEFLSILNEVRQARGLVSILHEDGNVRLLKPEDVPQ